MHVEWSGERGTETRTNIYSVDSNIDLARWCDGENRSGRDLSLGNDGGEGTGRRDAWIAERTHVDPGGSNKDVQSL